MDLRNWRENYDKYSLKEEGVLSCPFDMFQEWFVQAQEDNNPEPNAMILSTSIDGIPNSRVVLLKEILDKKYFVFYTNYNSKKGHEMAKNPQVSLLFYWYHSQRQVRLKGKVSKLDDKKSDEYFSSRPIESQIAAIASPQSEKVDFEDLIHSFENVEERGVKRPDHWGGYQVDIEYFEFWQGQPARLHDRIVYEQEGDKWKTCRLAP